VNFREDIRVFVHSKKDDLDLRKMLEEFADQASVAVGIKQSVELFHNEKRRSLPRLIRAATYTNDADACALMEQTRQRFAKKTVFAMRNTFMPDGEDPLPFSTIVQGSIPQIQPRTVLGVNAASTRRAKLERRRHSKSRLSVLSTNKLCDAFKECYKRIF